MKKVQEHEKHTVSEDLWKLEQGKVYSITKVQILDILRIPLPTTKEQRLIVRVIGHPLGDWKISKPSRKHEYTLEAL